MVDSPISFLTRKLEQLPITDFLFLSKSLTDADDKKGGKRNPKKFLADDYRLLGPPTDNNPKYKHDDGTDKNKDEKIDTDKSDIDKSSNEIFSRDCRHFCAARAEPTTRPAAKTRSCKPSANVSSLSPIFSKSLPTTSSSARAGGSGGGDSMLKRSPSKRKRSEVETNLLGYNYYGEASTFTRSCDFEVLNICKRDFRNIQRTLSFDDDLLRSNDDNDNVGNNTKMASSLLLMPQCRQNRLTCKSQPSYSAMTSLLVKPRKFKIVSPSNITILDERSSNKTCIKDYEVSRRDVSEPPPISNASLFPTTLSNITPRGDEFRSIGGYSKIDL